MNLVLTMAGQYSCFKLFGSKVPKYLLPLATNPVLPLDLVYQETHGSGCVGSHTVIALQEQGFECIVIDNLINSDLSVGRRIRCDYLEASKSFSSSN